MCYHNYHIYEGMSMYTTESTAAREVKPVLTSAFSPMNTEASTGLLSVVKPWSKMAMSSLNLTPTSQLTSLSGINIGFIILRLIKFSLLKSSMVSIWVRTISLDMMIVMGGLFNEFAK